MACLQPSLYDQEVPRRRAARHPRRPTARGTRTEIPAINPARRGARSLSILRSCTHRGVVSRSFHPKSELSRCESPHNHELLSASPRECPIGCTQTGDSHASTLPPCDTQQLHTCLSGATTGASLTGHSSLRHTLLLPRLLHLRFRVPHTPMSLVPVEPRSPPGRQPPAPHP